MCGIVKFRYLFNFGWLIHADGATITRINQRCPLPKIYLVYFVLNLLWQCKEDTNLSYSKFEEWQNKDPFWLSKVTKTTLSGGVFLFCQCLTWNW